MALFRLMRLNDEADGWSGAKRDDGDGWNDGVHLDGDAVWMILSLEDVLEIVLTQEKSFNFFYQIL